MTRIRHNQQYFEIDYEANAAYYDAKTESSELYARNFAAQMRSRYPEISDFISAFAVDLVKPDAMSFSDCDDGVRYDVSYSAAGSVEGTSEYNVKLAKMPVSVRQESEGKLLISVSGIVLPWVLIDKRPSEGPAAEEKGFLRRLLRRK